ncbi:MAG: protein translocase subunit SecF [Thermodesulfobacteriota bacterium]
MQIIKPDTRIDFIGKRKIAFCLSAAIFIMTVVSLVVHKGPRLGVDFAGGSLIQIKLAAPAPIDAITDAFKEVNISATQVQEYGQSAEKDYQYLINTDATAISEEGFTDRITDVLKAKTGLAPEIMRVEMVGPKVGQDLRDKALKALLYSLLFMGIYISGRFQEKWLEGAVIALGMFGFVQLLSILKVDLPILIMVTLGMSLALFWLLKLPYALGAIVALLHDVIVTIGFLSVFNKEFTLLIIAALLTIIGFSINDTIVIFDRLRERLKNNPKMQLEENINITVNETLSRTILTSLTVFIVLLVMFFFSGSIIHDFVFALLIGCTSGVYSTLYIANPILLVKRFNNK